MNAQEQFRLSNKNVYTNITYSGKLNEKWKLYAGASLSYNKDNIERYVIAKDTVNNYFLPDQQYNRTGKSSCDEESARYQQTEYRRRMAECNR